MKRIFAWAAAAVFLSSGAASAQTQMAAGAVDETTSAEDGAEDVAGGGADIFARDKFTIETIVCPFKGEIKYEPGEISCGLLTVPENREKSRSRQIKLHFVKLSARKPEKWNDKEKGAWEKRADPIIYLTGGPGAQAAGYVKRLKDHGARDVRDRTDRDTITVEGARQFERIRFCVYRRPVHFHDIDVRFANGGHQDVSVRERVNPGQCTRAIDLNGDDRNITTISMLYEETSFRRGHATVRVFAE